MILYSTKYPDLYVVTSNIRKKYGNASIDCINKYNDSVWIVTNINNLPINDIALIAEYNRDPKIREVILQKLYSTVW